MKKIVWVISISVLALGFLGCSKDGTIDEKDLSLRKGPVTNTVDQAMPEYSSKDPGGNKRFGSAYYGAPPMIPHTTVETELNAGTNDCLDCHQEGDEDTPGLPPSHFIKARFKTEHRSVGKQGQLNYFDGFYKASEVAGNRYDCQLCHAPQAENVNQLVQNDFQSEEPASNMADVLDGLNDGGKF